MIVKNSLVMIVDFGKYKHNIKFLNEVYNNICNKITNFALEGGKDPYNRRFFAEPFLTFAIEKEITNLSAEEIYKEYVYWKISDGELNPEKILHNNENLNNEEDILGDYLYSLFNFFSVENTNLNLNLKQKINIDFQKTTMSFNEKQKELINKLKEFDTEKELETEIKKFKNVQY